MILNRNSLAYRTGRLAGKIILLGLGYIVGKRWGRKPIEKGFPEKK
jgi:hypothetical protein